MKSLLLFFLSVACLPLVSATPAPLVNQNGDLIYLQQERTGDVKCSTAIPNVSSGDFSVQPAEVACPQSVLAATSLCIPKLSAAELYASLIATATTSIEPDLLEGNSLEERALW